MSEPARLIAPEKRGEDFDVTLRPQSLDEFTRRKAQQYDELAAEVAHMQEQYAQDLYSVRSEYEERLEQVATLIGSKDIPTSREVVIAAEVRIEG